jgi:PAS domain S-box-containing protein
LSANSRLDEVFGFERGEQIGRAAPTWYPDERSHAAGGTVDEGLARGETYHGEQQLQRQSGERFWCRLSGRAVEPGDLSRGTVWLTREMLLESRRCDRVSVTRWPRWSPG